jgi:hypothetical protein
MVELRSRTVTDIPAEARTIAAERPLEPEPMMAAEVIGRKVMAKNERCKKGPHRGGPLFFVRNKFDYL